MLPPLEVKLTDEEIVKKYFEDIPEMVDVAYCESRFRQFEKDGKVLRGIIDNDDSGILQINRRYHEKEAKELGYDIDTLMGNLKYGRYLYEKEGIKPWKASSKCIEARQSG